MSDGHMVQCEPCVPILKNKKKKRKGIKKKKGKEEKKSQNGREGRDRRGESEKRERERKNKIFSLLSKIFGNRTVGFRRSKRQSRFTHRELRVGTKILKFRQTPQGREFSYLN